jgi:Ankyrin repeats (3 copies)
VEQGGIVTTKDKVCLKPQHTTATTIDSLINLPLCIPLSQNGWTALHFAAQEGEGEVCRFLCGKGANPATKNGVRS